MAGAALSLDPIAVMVVATVALILTPIARVAVSMLAFAMDRDYAFVAITGFVLLAIVFTIFLGVTGRLV